MRGLAAITSMPVRLNHKNMIFKFTDGYSIVELKAGSYTEASKMVPIRYRLLTITKYLCVKELTK